MTKVKVVQFLEIGNLKKSQLNPCRLKKVMTKTSFNVKTTLEEFKTKLEFRLQMSRSHDPPVFGLSLMKLASIFPIVNPLKMRNLRYFFKKKRMISAFFFAVYSLKMERLNSSCFRPPSRAQKSASHSRHFGAHFKGRG